MTIYDFEMKDINGDIIKFSDYKNKVILIVNVASKCVFSSQYNGLELLFKKYKDQGLVILGFPCMQFKDQEFEENLAIKNYCSIKYDVTFPLFSRIDVKGENQAPLYKFLTSNLPWNNKKLEVKWNFEKFLIDQNGDLIKRFSSITSPKTIEKTIKKLF